MPTATSAILFHCCLSVWTFTSVCLFESSVDHPRSKLLLGEHLFKTVFHFFCCASPAEEKNSDLLLAFQLFPIRCIQKEDVQYSRRDSRLIPGHFLLCPSSSFSSNSSFLSLGSKQALVYNCVGCGSFHIQRLGKMVSDGKK